MVLLIRYSGPSVITAQGLCGPIPNGSHKVCKRAKTIFHLLSLKPYFCHISKILRPKNVMHQHGYIFVIPPNATANIGRIKNIY
jgi:hypothetical protein